MSESKNVTGLVLAGGQAQRMQQRDKGLLELAGKPLVYYALSALRPLVSDILISANRNQSLYAQLGYQVISDQTSDFQGPLAGLLAALQQVQTPIVLVVPCDVPLIRSVLLLRILDGLQQPEIEIAVAHDGQYLHPTLMAVRTELKSSLADYLQHGHRQIKGWIAQHRTIDVDVRDLMQQLDNINTPQQLADLGRKLLFSDQSLPVINGIDN